MTLSRRLTSAWRAARCAARNRRTRSSNDSGVALPGMPGGGRRELGAFVLVAGPAEDGDDFLLACGVFEVKRVASATVLGVLFVAILEGNAASGGWRARCSHARDAEAGRINPTGLQALPIVAARSRSKVELWSEGRACCVEVDRGQPATRQDKFWWCLISRLSSSGGGSGAVRCNVTLGQLQRQGTYIRRPATPE